MGKEVFFVAGGMSIMSLRESTTKKGETMGKSRSVLVVCLCVLATALLFVPAVGAAKTVYVGGTMSLTGPYAEDSAAILAAYEDYVKYVNETKHLAPWRNVSKTMVYPHYRAIGAKVIPQ
jgi:hypothetical protein